MAKERKLISKNNPRLFNIIMFKFIIKKNPKVLFQIWKITDYFEYYFLHVFKLIIYHSSTISTLLKTLFIPIYVCIHGVLHIKQHIIG